MLSLEPGQISISMKTTLDWFKSHWGGELVPSISAELSSTKHLSFLRSDLSPEGIWVANPASSHIVPGNEGHRSRCQDRFRDTSHQLRVRSPLRKQVPDVTGS